MAPYHREGKIPGSLPALYSLAPSADAVHPTTPMPLLSLGPKSPQYPGEGHRNYNSSGFCFNSCRKENAGEAWFL